MIAARLSAVGQVAGVAAAALCCYLVSQSVAGERAALAKLDRQIARAEEDIHRLSTEIGARSRMAQIERWNASVLALQAPRPSQFVADGIQLASLSGRGGRPQLQLDPAVMASKGAVNTVAYAPASSAAPAAPAAQEPAPEPMLRTASLIRPKPSAFNADTLPLTRASISVRPSAPQEERAAAAIAETARSVEDKPATAKLVAARQAAAKPVEKSASAKPVAAKPAPEKPVLAKAPAKSAQPRIASLLPSDIGVLAAAESTGGKAPPGRGAR